MRTPSSSFLPSAWKGIITKDMPIKCLSKASSFPHLISSHLKLGILKIYSPTIPYCRNSALTKSASADTAMSTVGRNSAQTAIAW